MDSKKIRFAFAINKSDDFESGNFCNAEKFSIYELVNKELVYVNGILNTYKSPEQEQPDGSEDNGKDIIELLNNHNVNVIVSSIYGKNLQMVNSQFIPVIVSTETPDEVIKVIKKHIKWIKDELKNRPAEFKLFTINKGILKTSVRKTH